MSTQGTAHERSALQSKKFQAFFLSEITWKIIVGMMVYYGSPSWEIFAVVIVAGFVEVTLIGGQAALDKYVRVAEIASRSGKIDPPSP